MAEECSEGRRLSSLLGVSQNTCAAIAADVNGCGDRRTGRRQDGTLALVGRAGQVVVALPTLYPTASLPHPTIRVSFYQPTLSYVGRGRSGQTG